MRVACLCILVALTAASTARADGCKLMRSSSLDMSTSRDGLIVVPVTINDTPQNMIVAPMAFAGMIGQKLVDAQGLKLHPLSQAASRNPAMEYGLFYFENGAQIKNMVQIASLTVGMEHASYTEFAVGPAFDDEGGKLAGSIGYDIWKHFDLDFDFANNKLNLFSQDHCPGKVVYWSGSYTDADAMSGDTGAPVVTMSLDGREVDATLDPGSSVTIMSLPEARAVFGIDENSPGVEALNQSTGTIYRAHFKSLTFSGISVSNLVVYLVPDKLGAQARKDLEADKLNSYQGRTSIATPHLTVGLNVLRHLHLYFAYKENKVYATAADAH